MKNNKKIQAKILKMTNLPNYTKRKSTKLKRKTSLKTKIYPRLWLGSRTISFKNYWATCLWWTTRRRARFRLRKRLKKRIRNWKRRKLKIKRIRESRRAVRGVARNLMGRMRSQRRWELVGFNLIGQRNRYREVSWRNIKQNHRLSLMSRINW